MSEATDTQFTMVRDKQIIVGITGGIAAYKAAELVRTLAKKGAHVHVVMTKHAMEFVTPLTFQTLSGNPVTHEMFELLAGSKIGHIALSDLADQMVIAPATANILGKVANGIADDFLSTMIMATKVPVLFVPAMNTKMWESQIVQGNIDKLRANGYEFIEPESGDLACGWEGKGRMPPVEDIVERMEDIFTVKDLVGERIMVTAGPTQEFIDPVRCITNRSSGKMGYALAKIARRRGAEVILITGRTDQPRPAGVRVIDIVTATEMRNAVMEHQERCTVIIKAAAVADFRCKALNCHKIKKRPGEEEISLELDRNPDILGELGKIKEDR
ncbi:MAG: phosphopantothenoylcysteine decarboxylase, partial [Deltaproteobacteria bacterium]|nr:phosphopantothenoylcysteine decarboxylase [Deltaproteobacteria bacterium]